MMSLYQLYPPMTVDTLSLTSHMRNQVKDYATKSVSMRGKNDSKK